jgi:hypothetical protein
MLTREIISGLNVLRLAGLVLMALHPGCEPLAFA